MDDAFGCWILKAAIIWCFLIHIKLILFPLHSSFIHSFLFLMSQEYLCIAMFKAENL